MRLTSAMDFVINVKLRDDNKDGFATMTGELASGCYDEKYRGMDTAEVYHARKESGEDPPQGVRVDWFDGTRTVMVRR